MWAFPYTIPNGFSTRVAQHVVVVWDSPELCGTSPPVGEIAQLVTGAGLAWGAVLVVCTCATVLAAVLLARASLPARLERRIGNLQAEVESFRHVLGVFTADQAQHESTLRSLVEEAEHAFDRAERKRRSAAATESRSKANAQEVPQDRAGLINMMRARGAS